VEAESELKLNDISQAIMNNSCSGGFQWKYYNGDCSDIPTLVNTWTKYNKLPIIMCDLNGKIIKNYSSVKECVKEHPEFTSAQINRVLKGIIKSHK
jgi:hypothetical protein